MQTLSHPKETKEALEQYQRRIRLELEQARHQGDLSRIAQLKAMQSVLAIKALPMACPFTVLMAGRAAVASLRGEAESECCAEAYRRYGHCSEGKFEVSAAIRLLKVTRLWPWADSA